MAAIDCFCSGDDRHRVILLVDLLEKAGQPVILHCEPVEITTRPLLVACTRRALREPWIAALFTRSEDVVAIRLDDAPLPARCARVIDMQAWPARSADRKVGALAHWLEHGDAAPRRPAGHEPLHADAASDHAPGTRARRRVEAAARDPNLPGGLALLGLLVLGGLLLANLAERPAVPERLESNQRDPGWQTPSAVSSTGSPASAGGADRIGMMPASNHNAAARSAADAAAPRREAAASQAVAAPERERARRNDAVRHLCEAQSLAAARAWAGTLSWKQRRRLAHEACVAQLLLRPGFEPLARLLDLS